MKKKKLYKKIISEVAVGLMTLSMLSGCGSPNATESATNEKSEIELADNTDKGAEMDIARTIKLNKSNVQKFNDTNGDGYGEFEGWGTSLCWWANRLGYNDKLTQDAAEAFYNKETGLGMNIGRYNIGGGDNVIAGDVTVTMKEKNPFLHKEHIRRSDSVVPGYCKDVTKIDLTENTKEYYESNFERADFECGFAWNYNWDADKRQMNILKAAAKASGDEFIGEAFSNSPPYFMTVSGCSSGNENPGEDNLREDSYTAFACYMADVIEHWSKEGVIDFQSVDPMNEPASSYWGANSDKQEGCHFSQGESQSRILTELDKELKKKGINIIICGTDETSIDAAIASYDRLSDEAKKVVTRIDTHTYMGSMRKSLKETAEKAGINLWMSEVDGTYSIGEAETGMSAALGFAEAMMTDLNGLMPTAWIMWDAVDLHVDSKNKFDNCSRKEADRIIDQGLPFWGIAIADHDTKELLLSKKYYAYGQFSRYIRPGYCLVESSNVTVSAYNPEDNSIVIVAMNSNTDDLTWEFDLSDFDVDMKEITAIRTSGDVNNGENWENVTESDNINVNGKMFTATVKGSSITTYIIR
ncbi:glycoside hydrolase [Butyrivibrio sp. YAB3001]|uniref:glycoside hydrolase n=1 Tax=Butyrivibrio sp. YAB3001 TaxID=1520812 RepID=UPI0008F665CB|nr:glycoside hydrolase [Butyrivibrio sp. YAB3001]SFC88284.1 O-Glycosyl hydrolase [Butyrivibrio sp. YAB3001]